MSRTPEGWRPFERALTDAWHGNPAPLLVRSDVGEDEVLDPSIFLRTPEAFQSWEFAALERAVAPVLDVGAGGGSHALALQARGMSVVAIDASEGALEVMRARGVKRAVRRTLEELAERGAADLAPDWGSWRTVCFLMNGTMPFGTLTRLQTGLERLRAWDPPPDRVLIDSTDLRGEGGVRERDDGRYVGEAHYQMTYEGVAGPLMQQLFVDPDTLAELGARTGWTVEVLVREEDGHFLAELRPAIP